MLIIYEIEQPKLMLHSSGLTTLHAYRAIDYPVEYSLPTRILLARPGIDVRRDQQLGRDSHARERYKLFVNVRVPVIASVDLILYLLVCS